MTETFYHEKDGILNWNYKGLDLNESTSQSFDSVLNLPKKITHSFLSSAVQFFV